MQIDVANLHITQTREKPYLNENENRKCADFNVCRLNTRVRSRNAVIFNMYIGELQF